MEVNTWSTVLQESFQNVSETIIQYVPQLIIALLILLVGWVLGILIGRLIAEVIRSVKLDEALRRAGLADVLRRADIVLDSGRFVGALVKWFVIIVFLVAALDVLNLTQVTNFLETVVLNYIPQVIGAVLIVLIAAVVGDVLQRLITASAQTAEIKFGVLAGKIAKWAVWIAAILMALDQLKVDTTLLHTAFTGLIVAFSLALGISFGLGGKDAAAQFIEKTRDEIKK